METVAPTAASPPASVVPRAVENAEPQPVGAPQATGDSVAVGEGGSGGKSQGEYASISAGRKHACGVKTDGDVACWGDDEYDQATPPEGEFVSVSTGGHHTCGTKTDGDVVCWGAFNREDTRALGKFVSISTGGWQTCGVRTDGAVICWGNENTVKLVR